MSNSTAVEPIKPEEVLNIIPEAHPQVVKAFNALIAKNWNARAAYAQIDQEEVVDLILVYCPNLTDSEIHRQHMLDVESTFTAAGWDVTYSKPGWNETGKAYFVFKPRIVAK